VDDPFATLPRPETVDVELAFPVMRRDLDQNRHVNNAVYLQWGLEAVPDGFYASALPMDLALNFRSEAFAGETVRSRIQIRGEGEGTACIHQILAGDGRELARLLTVWPGGEPAPEGPCPFSAA
jgi:medium-chain acyl-[acyl-carrier-protein] hydrolase